MIKHTFLQSQILILLEMLQQVTYNRLPLDKPSICSASLSCCRELAATSNYDEMFIEWACVMMKFSGRHTYKILKQLHTHWHLIPPLSWPRTRLLSMITVSFRSYKVPHLAITGKYYCMRKLPSPWCLLLLGIFCVARCSEMECNHESPCINLYNQTYT